MFDENREFTDAQLAQQETFRQATVHAKKAKTQPVYVENAKAKNSTSYNKAVADWFGKPQVLSVNAQGYTGQNGHTIQVKAEDDTKVTRVTVVIHNNDTILEEGEAVQSETDGLLWTYITTRVVSLSPAPVLDASVYDLAGNCGATSISLN